MSSMTHRSNPRLVASVNNSEMLGRREVVAPPTSDRRDSQARRDENTVECGEFMARLLKEAPDQIHTNLESVIAECVVSDFVVEGPVNRSEVSNIMRGALN